MAEAGRVVALIDEAGVLHGYLDDRVFEPGLTRGYHIVWRRGASITGRPYLARGSEVHAGLEVVELLMTASMSAEEERTLTWKPEGLESFVPAAARGTWYP